MRRTQGQPSLYEPCNVTVLGLVGGAPGGGEVDVTVLGLVMCSSGRTVASAAAATARAAPVSAVSSADSPSALITASPPAELKPKGGERT